MFGWNNDDKKPRKPWSPQAKIAFGVATGLLVAITGYRSYDSVPQNSFGVRVKNGEIQSALLKPGYLTKSPVLDTIYSFSNNVIILETVAGGARNTKDQNDFGITVRLHYQIRPDVGVLAFHLDELGSQNGKDLLTRQMSNSIDAVVGQMSAQEALASPAQILKSFVPQFEWRLKQNNIAVEIDTIELLDVKMGGGLRLPVQLMVKPGHEVQPMAGPSAIPVTPPTAPKAP